MSNVNLNLKHERLLKIILAPYVSEKATFLGEKNNQAIFRVANDATKKEIIFIMIIEIQI